MACPFDMANAIGANRVIDAAAERWIVGAFSAWWHDGSDPEKLTTFLRWPTGKRTARASRNYWLRIAADELGGVTPAAELKRSIDAFMRYKWPSWSANSTPPDDASQVEQCLFYAATSGASLRLSRRQLCNIIGK